MIVADLDTIEHQMPQTSEFRQAIAFLRRKDLPDLPDGKTAIDGTRVFAILQRIGPPLTTRRSSNTTASTSTCSTSSPAKRSSDGRPRPR
jgi:beta-galactosidase beta subunit